MQTQFTIRGLGGRRSGYSVVLLPGLFAGAWIWEKTAERLQSNGVDTIVLINEGFAVVQCMRAGSVALATDAVMNALIAGRLQGNMILCGNSFGGLVALDAAIRYPDRVSAVVVSGAPGLTPDPDFGLAHRVDLNFAHQAVARLFHDKRRVPIERVEETFKILVMPGPLRNIVKGLKAAREYDVRAALARLACPSLFVWGALDEISPVGPWVDVLATVDRSQLELIPDSGHSPMLESPELFADKLTKFVAQTQLLAGRPADGRPKQLSVDNA